MTALLSRLRFFGPIVVLLAIGVVSAGYLLVKQRFPVPFQNTYEVKAELRSADGVAPGFGQAVNVSGVKVGTITKADVRGDRAAVVFTIDRNKLRTVHRDARADLRPITPLKDMLVELDPGTRAAGALPPGEAIGLARTSVPVALADLLSTLDADTRTFLEGLVGGLAQGTEDRAPDLRAALRSLGPTADELGRVSRALDRRRQNLARLVHNLSKVTEAARSDERLADVVVAGHRTLAAIAAEDEPLRRTLADLPRTLESADTSLRTVGTLADELVPTLRALNPPVKDLPRTLAHLRPLTADFASLLEREFRPLVKAARPTVDDLAPALRDIGAVLPDTSRTLQSVTWFLNELGYDPPGEDGGMRKWLAWLGHNFNSVASTADAHGAINRALPILVCPQLTAAIDLFPLMELLTGTVGGCPSTAGITGPGTGNNRAARSRLTDDPAQAAAAATARNGDR